MSSEREQREGEVHRLGDNHSDRQNSWIRFRSQVFKTFGSEAGTGASGSKPPGPETEFELQDLINEGGQGEVWSAVQTSLQRQVAVKLPRRDQMDRFLRECFISAALDHPNIPAVHGFQQASQGLDGAPLMAMKLLQGVSWDKQLAASRPGPSAQKDEWLHDQVRILIQVCNPLEYAHSKGIVHGDVKPANVHLGPYGEVYLLDWGLAVVLPDESGSEAWAAGVPASVRSSGPCAEGGTAEYMAPEQASSDLPISKSTDIYLLGAILYELLSGSAPHADSSPSRRMEKGRTNRWAPLTSDIPAELTGLVSSCLESDPRKRPSSVREFREALEGYLEGRTQRKQGQQMLDQVADWLAHASEARTVDYDRLREMQRLLEGAARLLPGSKVIGSLNDRLCARFAQVALDGGDLSLARLQAERIQDNEIRQQLTAAVDAERDRIARRNRQRITFAVAAIALLIALVSSFAYQQHSALRLETQKTAAVKEASTQKENALREQHQREVAELAAEEQRKRSELLSQTMDLIEDEQDVRNRLTQFLPLPGRLAPEDDIESVAISNSRALEPLLQEGDELDARRASLDAETGGLDIAPPIELLLGKAHLQFYAASNQEDLQRAFEMYERVAANQPEAPEPLIGMGICAYRLGDMNKAASLLQEAASLSETSRGSNHPVTELAFALGAEVCGDLGRDEEAFSLFKKSQEIMQPEWAKTTASMAHQALALGKYESAHQFAESVADAPADAIIDPLIRCDAHEWAAMASFRLGDLDDAQKHYNACYTLRLENLGPDDPLTAYSLVEQAMVLGNRGESDKAELLFLEFFKKTESVRPQDFPRLPTAMASYATSLYEEGRFVDAEEIYRRAVSIREELNGKTHPWTAYLQHCLATTLLREMNYEEGLNIAEKACASLERAYGPEHPTSMDAQRIRSSLLLRLARYDEARPLAARSLAYFRSRFGDNHADTAYAMISASIHHIASERYADAWTMIARALETLYLVHGETYAGTTGAEDQLLLVFSVMNSELREDYMVEVVPLILSRLDQEHSDALLVSADRVGGDFLRTREGLVLALLQEGDRDTARSVLERSSILADLADLPADHDKRVRFLNRLVEQLQPAHHPIADTPMLMRLHDELKAGVTPRHFEQVLSEIVTPPDLESLRAKYGVGFASILERNAARRQDFERIVDIFITNAEPEGAAVVADAP